MLKKNLLFLFLLIPLVGLLLYCLLIRGILLLLTFLLLTQIYNTMILY